MDYRLVAPDGRTDRSTAGATRRRRSSESGTYWLLAEGEGTGAGRTTPTASPCACPPTARADERRRHVTGSIAGAGDRRPTPSPSTTAARPRLRPAHRDAAGGEFDGLSYAQTGPRGLEASGTSTTPTARRPIRRCCGFCGTYTPRLRRPRRPHRQLRLPLLDLAAATPITPGTPSPPPSRRDSATAIYSFKRRGRRPVLFRRPRPDRLLPELAPPRSLRQNPIFRVDAGSDGRHHGAAPMPAPTRC